MGARQGGQAFGGAGHALGQPGGGTAMSRGTMGGHSVGAGNTASRGGMANSGMGANMGRMGSPMAGAGARTGGHPGYAGSAMGGGMAGHPGYGGGAALGAEWRGTPAMAGGCTWGVMEGACRAVTSAEGPGWEAGSVAAWAWEADSAAAWEVSEAGTAAGMAAAGIAEPSRQPGSRTRYPGDGTGNEPMITLGPYRLQGQVSDAAWPHGAIQEWIVPMSGR